MGWKRIFIGGGQGTRNVNENPNPLGNSRKDLTPASERELRLKHQELLNHENDLLSSRKNFAASVSTVGSKQGAQLLSEILGRPIRFSTLHVWWQKARLGLRTNIPRFDWKENCTACARPLNEPVSSMDIVPISGRTKGERRGPISEDEREAFVTNATKYYESQDRFRSKAREFAYLVKQLGPQPISRLFDVPRSSVGAWARQILSISNNSTNVHHFNADSKGNCMHCKRPLVVADTAEGLTEKMAKGKKEKKADPNQPDLFSDPTEQLEDVAPSRTRRSRSENYILQYFPAQYNGRCHGYTDTCHKNKLVSEGDAMVKLIPGKGVPGPSFFLHEGPCADKAIPTLDEQATKAIRNR